MPSFAPPVAKLQAPGDANRWFVVEQGGRIKTFSNRGDVTSTTTFLDISARTYRCAQESGLLSMAFHPKFASNGCVYLFYQTRNNATTSRLARFTSRNGRKP